MSNSDTQTTIIQEYATGEEINEVVVALEDALTGVKEAHAVMGMLSLTVLFMHPYVTPDQLQKAVEDISNYICISVSPEGDATVEDVEKAKLN